MEENQSQSAHLLIIDDNEDILTQLKWGLASEAYTLHLATDMDQAIEIFRKMRPGADGGTVQANATVVVTMT